MDATQSCRTWLIFSRDRRAAPGWQAAGYALPLELLKEEQDRISSQEESVRAEVPAAEADLGKWQEALSLAIRLAGSCHAAYLKARPKVVPASTKAVLEAVYIKDRQLQRAEFTEVVRGPFLAPEFE